MKKLSKPGKNTVELSPAAPRPSKIRRDPPPPQRAAKLTVLPDDPEREAWTILIGVLLFGIAITVIIIGFSDYTSG
jgi:hypothetical protein